MNIVIVGGSGTAGRSIINSLGNDLSVLAVSRSRPPEALPEHVRWKPVDLESRALIREAFHGEPVDVLIYAAAGQPIVSKYQPFNVAALRRLGQRVARRTDHQQADFLKAAMMTQTYDPGHRNFELFNNVVEVLQERSIPLKHIVLLTGGMSYGIQTGPIFNPQWDGVLYEHSPRHPGPNWYYDMEDYAAYLQRTYCPVTLLRPSYILYEGGFVRQNLAHSIGLYLESQRQIGGKAVFPGGEENYRCSWSFTPSTLIGRQVDWVIRRPDVWGEVFNSVAQQPVTWSVLWPRLAAAYGLEVEVPRQPLSLGRHVRAHIDDYWLITSHGYDTDYFTPIDFIDIAMVCYWNMIYSMEKAANLGFDSHADVFQPFAQEQLRMKQWLAGAKTRGAFKGAHRHP